MLPGYGLAMMAAVAVIYLTPGKNAQTAGLFRDCINRTGAN